MNACTYREYHSNRGRKSAQQRKLQPAGPPRKSTLKTTIIVLPKLAKQHTQQQFYTKDLCLSTLMFTVCTVDMIQSFSINACT